MSNPQIEAKLRKLAEMVRQGVGGERDNAETIFDRLLKEHGLRREDFFDTGEAASRVNFSVATKRERSLLIQVAAKVLNDRNADVWSTRGKLSPLGFEMTKAQAAETRFLFGLYRQAWEVEAERLFLAFVNKHNIFPETPIAEPQKPMDRGELAKLKSMMDGMDSVAVHKALEAK